VIWVILLLGAAGIAWFLLAPRRFQTLENTPAVVNQKLKADSLIETTEDPREVRPIAQKAAHRSGDAQVLAEKPISKAQRNPRPPS